MHYVIIVFSVILECWVVVTISHTREIQMENGIDITTVVARYVFYTSVYLFCNSNVFTEILENAAQPKLK